MSIDLCDNCVFVLYHFIRDVDMILRLTPTTETSVVTELNLQSSTILALALILVVPLRSY